MYVQRMTQRLYSEVYTQEEKMFTCTLGFSPWPRPTDIAKNVSLQLYPSAEPTNTAGQSRKYTDLVTSLEIELYGMF